MQDYFRWSKIVDATALQVTDAQLPDSSPAEAQACVILGQSPFAPRSAERLRTVNTSLKTKVRRTLTRDLERNKNARCVSIQGHNGRLSWWRLQTGLQHLAPGLWERWEAARSSSSNSARGHSSQTSAGRGAHITGATATSGGGCGKCGG